LKKEIVIEVKNISKTFKKENQRVDSFRSIFLNKKDKLSATSTEVHALSEINFQIEKGETFGIIGRNGSGKSTLVHLIIGCMKADPGGSISTHGKILRLALGLGMDPNLSARDNIYINGSVLGLSFKEIGLRFYDILDYAGLNDFVDTPIKNFSKGMQARLKFSIAMYAKADIFLLDEFFGGVGDEEFKQKSNDAFKKSIVDQKTILIISHNKSIIEKHCDRVLWINGGKMKMIGKPDEVVAAYHESFIKKNKTP